MALAWDVTTSKPRLCFAGNSDAISAVTFSPDGRRIAIGSWDNTARVWDIMSGVPLQRLQSHGGNGQSVAHAWCGPFQQVVDRRDRHGDVRSVVFSPDSRFVLTGSRDGTHGCGMLRPARSSIAFRARSGSTHCDLLAGWALHPDGE